MNVNNVASIVRVLTLRYHSFAGHWLFKGRRWLNPNCMPDMVELESRFQCLCKTYPVDSGKTWPKIIEILQYTQAHWRPAKMKNNSLRHSFGMMESAPHFSESSGDNLFNSIKVFSNRTLVNILHFNVPWKYTHNVSFALEFSK